MISGSKILNGEGIVLVIAVGKNKFARKIEKFIK